MRKPVIVFLFLFVVALFLHNARGEELENRVVRHAFKNGLVLLMVERHIAPTVSFQITYKAGSVNEYPGITGIAHLYEHMAFKGTEKVGTRDFKAERPVLAALDKAFGELKLEREQGKEGNPKRIDEHEKEMADLEKKEASYSMPNEVGEIYRRNGATGLNANTGKDFTNYVVSLPSNRLPLWIALESDRMTHPVLREFYKEKQVVLEERRMRTENSPAGKLYEALMRTAFWIHPYGLPVIGWSQDVQSLSRKQTEDFFKVYYGINNIVIAIVGDIHPDQVVAEMEKTFGRIPPQPLPPPVPFVEPPQEGERRVHVDFPANPLLFVGYHRPAVDDPDDVIFDIIDSLLSDGRTSRLYKHLVTEKEIAQSIGTDASTPGGRYPSLFLIEGEPRAPHTLDELEKAIDQEISVLKSEPVGAREFQKLKNQFDGSLIRALESNSGLAGQLAYFEALTGDWKSLLKQRKEMEHIKPEDIMRVAKRYFVENNRVVATLSGPALTPARKSE